VPEPASAWLVLAAAVAFVWPVSKRRKAC
jgi:hypothetical protein